MPKRLTAIISIFLILLAEICAASYIDTFLYSFHRRLLVSRFVFFLVVMLSLSVAVRLKSKIAVFVREFFSTPEHPLNLAVFRVVLFGTLYQSSDLVQLIQFSQIPSVLIFPPFGTEWILRFLPINTHLAIISWVIFRIFCLSAMIGYCTRISILGTILSALYVLGIPQFFGKVDHPYLHLIWFAMILSVSPCADLGSVDALLTLKKTKAVSLRKITPSLEYALPLRFVWLLIGIIYFFPGVWKLWKGGFDWALSENIQFTLYLKWYEFSDWVSSFRLDHHPILYRLFGLGAIVFELSFIFLIFLPRMRLWIAGIGLLFHNLTNLVFRISFWNLQTCYVAFVNWHQVFQKIGKRFSREKLYVIYDGHCSFCIQTVNCLQMFDVFDQLICVNANDRNQLNVHPLSGLDREAILKDMHVVDGKNVYLGFSAYRALARRIPICWIFLPFCYLGFVNRIGNQVYRTIADHRQCAINVNKTFEAQSHPLPGSSLNGIVVVGILSVLMNIYVGTKQITQGWPFACYPTFSDLAHGTTTTIEIEADSFNGKKVVLTQHQMSNNFEEHRFRGLLSKILATKDKKLQEMQLNALWTLYTRYNSHLGNIKTVYFYRVERLTSPEMKKHNLLKRELILVNEF